MLSNFLVVCPPYPLAAPGGVGIIASPKVSHCIAANLMAPSPSLARLPQPPEASFRSLASEWVTPHFLRLPETLAESFRFFGVAALARVLAFLTVLNHFKAPPPKGIARPPRETLRLLLDSCRCWQEP